MGVKVVVKEENVPSFRDESVFSSDDLLSDHDVTLGHEAPSAWAESLVEDAAVLDLGEVDYAVGFYLDVGWVDWLEEDVDYFFGEAGCA